MASKNHVASQKKISPKFVTGSSILSGVNGGRAKVSDDANVLKKGPWSPQEDALLIKYVKNEGERNWKNVQKTGLMRCGKSCRLRWTNHLHPDLKKGFFSFEEEKIVIQMHRKVGNRWSKIAAKLPGRTDNEVKNFWNTKIKKRMMSSSPETIEESFSSTQKSEALNETPSISPPMNSPTPLFSLQNSQMKLNSSNSSINSQPTFSITKNSNKLRLNLLTDSIMHEDPMISFTKDSTYQINFMAKEGEQNSPLMSNVFKNPNAKPFLGAHVLEFATGSTYYNPNPFSCVETQMGSIILPPILAEESTMRTNSFGYDLDNGVWNYSLSYEPKIKLEVQEQGHDQVSFLNGINFYYNGLSTMEVTPKKDSMEDEMESMDDELSSLLNSFSFDDSSPELHLKTEGENSVSSYKIHYYLDQKVAFPSFSKASVSAITTSGSESPRSTSSEFNECFDVEDWIIIPE